MMARIILEQGRELTRRFRTAWYFRNVINAAIAKCWCWW